VELSAKVGALIAKLQAEVAAERFSKPAKADKMRRCPNQLVMKGTRK